VVVGVEVLVLVVVRSAVVEVDATVFFVRSEDVVDVVDLEDIVCKTVVVTVLVSTFTIV